MSKEREIFIKAIEEANLPNHEWLNVLLYVYTLKISREGRKVTPPPTPAQWSSYPLWFKWKIYLIALFWYQVHKLQEKLLSLSKV